MGFSKDNFEQYRKEIRIMWRVLAVGVVVAGGIHIVSLPWISRMVSGPVQKTDEIEATPIEIVVDEEVVQQTPDPDPQPPEENPEPAASAERPSAAPLATNVEPIPTSEIASADTVAVMTSIATENGEIAGEGAVGDSAVVGLITGSGEPAKTGDRINLPDISALIEPELEPEPELPAIPREPVQEIALAERRSPSSRLVSCNPCTSPNYPTTARRENIEGQPVINAIFDSSGRVTEAAIEVSSGNAAFDQAALEEARKNWRFQDPAGLGGQVSVDVVYVIDDSEQSEEVQEAGEILAVEIPTAQQVQSITSDSPPAPANSPPATSLDVEAPEAGTESSEINDASPEDTSIEERSPAEESENSDAEPVTDSPPVNLKPANSEPATTEPAVPEPIAPEPVAPAEPIAPVEPPNIAPQVTPESSAP